MTKFEEKFFKKQTFSEKEIKQFLGNARHDLKIAQTVTFPEVCFTYSFQALIKAGIALIAKVGGVKVRSIPGHHAMIMEKMSEILKDPDIKKIGHAMRTTRNTDLYGGGKPIGENEARDYFKFTESVLQKVEKAVSKGGSNGDKGDL